MKADADQQQADDRTAAKAERQASASSARQPQSGLDRFTKNMLGSVGRSLGNALVRGILGGLTRR